MREKGSLSALLMTGLAIILVLCLTSVKSQSLCRPHIRVHSSDCQSPVSGVRFCFANGVNIPATELSPGAYLLQTTCQPATILIKKNGFQTVSRTFRVQDSSHLNVTLPCEVEKCTTQRVLLKLTSDCCQMFSDVTVRLEDNTAVMKRLQPWLVEAHVCSLPSGAEIYRNALSIKTVRLNPGVNTVVLPCTATDEWGTWQCWSQCGATCLFPGEARPIQSRTRSCTSPLSGGESPVCEGSSSESRLCDLPSCFITEGWLPWLPWSACTSTCHPVDGTPNQRTRSRICANPPVQAGGAACPGDAMEFENCTGLTGCPPIRLLAGDGTDGINSGLLQLYYNGGWGTVCDDSDMEGSTETTRVACQMMGFSDGVGAIYSLGDIGTIIFDDIDCEGGETTLFDCPGTEYDVGSDCDHEEDVGLICV